MSARARVCSPVRGIGFRAVVTGARDQYLGVVGFDAVTEYMRTLEQEAAHDH